jgi:hypothetical protein
MEENLTAYILTMHIFFQDQEVPFPCNKMSHFQMLNFSKTPSRHMAISSDQGLYLEST